MLKVADALATVLRSLTVLPRETVDIDGAVGRVLVKAITASRALPGFDNSAMDGYAARAAELPATLPLAGVVAAGGERIDVPALHAARIFTGAPVPSGLDTVVMQEDTKLDGERVVLPASAVGENIRRKGEDVAVGERILDAGSRVRPWDIGILAALGEARVEVSRKPRVALVATGDELVDIATEPAYGQLVDSSAHALAALVREAGGEPYPLGVARDTARDITAMLERALGFDAVITTGGVSVGDRDHVRTAFNSVGVSLELYKVAMKPGKPFSFGLRDQVPVFGLPGNPVSTVVAFELFVRPALLAMQGALVTARPRVEVALPGGYRKPAGRAHYLRAHVKAGVATIHPKQGSAMLSSLLGSNALVEIPADATAVDRASAILLEVV